jgi:dTDP-4-amino-4,6-dideoxygalactose transaminase
MSPSAGTSQAWERKQAAELPSWPYFAEDEIQAATEVLRSGKVNYWTGDHGKQFEREFAEFAGCRHAVALANGTLALEAAVRGLGIGPGDEVIVPARTFIASASCAVAVGARPVVADISRESQNLTAESIRSVLTRRSKAIIAVHLAGWPCDMDSILALAREHGLKVIEDCAQALGATYNGRPVGSLGDAAAFSFCQDKILTTGGEGGMLTTNDLEVWSRAWSYKDHGKDYNTVHAVDHPPGFRWLHASFGSNWRMTEMQAAMGRVALRKVPQWIATRRKYAAMLDAAWSGLAGLRVSRPGAGILHSYYKYYAFVEQSSLRPGWERNRIMQAIQDRGVLCLTGSCGEIYLEKAFTGVRPAGRLPTARELADTSLMFLVHPTLRESDIESSAAVVAGVMQEASRPEPVAARAALGALAR